MTTTARQRLGRRRAAWTALSVAPAVTILALSIAHVGCNEGKDGETNFQSTAAVTPSTTNTVGPAPLRRLTNSQYLNTLADLYPAITASVASTLPPLPADLTVDGFDNAASSQQPSDVLIARYESIANIYAAAATTTTAAVQSTIGCADWSTADLATACATQFIATTGRHLFRRPLASDEAARYLTHFQGWQSAVDFPGAVQLTLSAMLQSPQFLYRPEPINASATSGTVLPLDPYMLASRLSFFLWESAPDEALFAAAAANALSTDDELHAQAERMLADPRAKRVFWSFPRQWLGLDRILLAEHAVRTPSIDPLWTTATQTAASKETEIFVENTLAEGGTFRDLMTSRRAWVNGEMSRIYGLPTPKDPNAWVEVMLPEAERAGLLTRASYLAGFSHSGATSPPVRGNAIELRFLCELPLTPPANANLSQPMQPADAGPETNRELFEARTAPLPCQACHVGLNGFGFGLETYNAAGHYQTTDNTLPVNASGQITGTDVDQKFTGGIELSNALSKSEMVHSCATQELVRYAFGRAPADAEAHSVTALAKSFMASGGDLRALMISVVMSPTFRMRLTGDD